METVTRETIETFRGQRTECKVTTQKTDYESTCPPDIIEALAEKATKAASNKSSGVNKVKGYNQITPGANSSPTNRKRGIRKWSSQMSAFKPTTNTVEDMVFHL